MKLKRIFSIVTLASIPVFLVLYTCSDELSKYLYVPQVPDSIPYIYVPWKNESTSCHGLTQWAVVSSSEDKMTLGMVKILDSTQQWCLLVVATHSKLWTVPLGLNTSHLIYLSITDLQALPYKLASYAVHSMNWKNVAYLYAIENGARTIYDMEESNFPLPMNGVYLSVEKSKQYYRSPILSEKPSKGMCTIIFVVPMINTSPAYR